MLLPESIIRKPFPEEVSGASVVSGGFADLTEIEEPLSNEIYFSS